MTTEHQYTIEGEPLTLRQIRARLVGRWVVQQ
jgi:hypothetical protein